MMKRILFVCLGNICRSPLAHGAAQSIAVKKKLNCKIDSAGTSSWHEGEAPCPNSIKVAEQYDVDISRQHSRPIVKEDITSFDYVVAMDQQNKTDLEALGFTNVYLLGQFGNYNGAEVPDPYYFKSYEGFEKVYTMVSACVEDLMEKVKYGTL